MDYHTNPDEACGGVWHFQSGPLKSGPTSDREVPRRMSASSAQES